MFADDRSFGSNAAAKILEAEKADGTRSSLDIIRQIYPHDAVRKAFLSRNKEIFKEDGSATIADALKTCADKFTAGFEEVRKLAHEIEASLPKDPESSLEEMPQGSLGDNIEAKSGRLKEIVNKLIEGAKAHGLDPMTVLTFIAIESDFNPTLCARSSSAAGLFQFIDSTWKAAGGPSFDGRGGKGNGQAAGAPVDLQIEIGCKFMVQNLHSLTASLGRIPTPVQTYMAHQQGIDGAIKISRRIRTQRSKISLVGMRRATMLSVVSLSVRRSTSSVSPIRTMRRKLPRWLRSRPRSKHPGFCRLARCLPKPSSSRSPRWELSRARMELR